MGFRIKIRDGKVVSSSGDTSNSIAQKFIKKHTSSSSSSSSGGSSRSSSSSSGGSSRSSSKSSSTPKLVGTTDKGKRIYEKSGEKYTIDQKTGKNITYKEPSKSKKEEAPKTDVFSKARGGQSFLSSRVSSSKGIKSGVYEPLTFEQAKKVKDKPKGLKEAIKKEETRRMVFEKPGKSTFYREIKEEPSKSATPKKEKPKPISLSQSVAEKSPLTQTEKSFTNKIDSRRMSVAKDTYGSALLRESKERYKPLFNLAKEGFKKIGQEASTFFTKPTESFKITGKKGKKARDTFEIVSRNISGATRSRAAFMSTPEFRTQSARKILTFIDPEIEKAKDITKSDWADYRKGITTSSVLRQEFQAPSGKEKLAGATLTAAELVAPEVALSKIPRFAKSSYYKTFGKYIEPDKIYSTKALESPSGLDLSFNPSKTITKFKESQKVAKGTPLEGLYPDDYMIGTSSTAEALKSRKILGKSDLGEPVTETGGTYISPLAFGQPRFTRIGKQDTYTKFSLNPFSAAQTETPQAYAVGVKKVQEFPKRLLRKDESVFSDIEAFQKSRVGRAESYITRESSLGIKKEPESVLNVGDEFSKLGTRPIYTTIEGKTVPVKPIKLVENKTLQDLGVSKSLLKTGSASKTKSLTKGDLSRISGDYYTKYSNTSYVTPPYGSLLSSAYSSQLKSYTPSTSITSSVTSSEPYTYSEGTIPISSSYTASSPTSSGGSSISTSGTGTSGSGTSRTGSSGTGTSGSGTSGTGSSGTGTSVSYTSSGKSLSSLLSTPKSSTKSRARIRLPSGKKSKSQINPTKPYQVQIKSEGKWVNVKDKTKRNYYNAFNRAVDIVDSYKERSFRLRPTTGNATRISRSYTPKKSQFYQPAKNKTLKGAFVEKSKYAIDSYNELKGITYKGIQANRKKRLKGIF